MWEERSIRVRPKKPMLDREVSKNYAHHDLLWRVNDNFEERGGNPTIVGFVQIKRVPRYKVEFPDGSTDYFRTDIFDDFYELEF